MGWNRRVVFGGFIATVGGVALGQPAQQITGPIAVYWMSATTSSGFSMGAMGGGGAGRGGGRGGIPDLSALMGGGGPTKTLMLQLGSSQSPNGQPTAEHLPPDGLKAGPSLPLVTPRPVASQPAEERPSQSVPQQYQRPSGRMLIFWGCGERAPQGQPVVIDFATITDPVQAQRLGQLMQGLAAAPMQPPSPSRNRTYGEWPNEQTRTSVPSDGSLAGPHTIRGNYSPQINFTMSPGQDFLAPLTLTTNAKNPGGWAQLGWNPVPNALGYFATAIGGGDRGSDTVVLWSSSESQVAAFTSPDFMPPAETRRLVNEHVLMSPQTTACEVYREVVQAAPSALLSMTAYGEEANFSFPPRPEDRTKPWNIQWEVKVRYKSTTGGILGQPMPDMGGGGRGGPPQGAQGQQPPPTPGRGPSAGDVLRGLGGLGGLRLPGR